MAKELTDIIKAAAEVRDETAIQQNTATRVGDKGGLILKNVNGASSKQYIFNNGKRYLRYVDFTSADRTAVKIVQAWKLDGAVYIFYDAANRIIYQRNQWDENISGGGPSTLPLASASERLKRNFMQETANY